MFLAEKCNLHPTLLHYKNLARHLVIHLKMLMMLALQPIGFNKYIYFFTIIDIQQFYISYTFWSTTVGSIAGRSGSCIAVMRRDDGHVAVVWRDGRRITVVRRDSRRVTVWHDGRRVVVVQHDSGHVAVMRRDSQHVMVVRQDSRHIMVMRCDG